MKRLHVVCSGGGSRGARHVGMFKALEEAKIPIEKMWGTSAGAIAVAAFSWVGAKELEALWLGIRKREDIFSGNFWVTYPWKSGLWSAKPLQKLLGRAFHVKQPGGIPFAVVACNIVTESRSFIESNDPDIVNLVAASGSIPVLVEPYVPEWARLDDGSVQAAYCDGGVMENLPVEQAANAEVLLVSHCGPLKKLYPQSIKLPNPIGMLTKTLEMFSAESYREDMEVCEPLPWKQLRIDLAPMSEGPDILDFDPEKAKALIEQAYKETWSIIPMLREALK